LGELATFEGNATLSGEPAKDLFPGGTLTGDVLTKKDLVVSFPAGFSPMVKVGERCDVEKPECVKVDSANVCEKCAELTCKGFLAAHALFRFRASSTASVTFSSNSLTAKAKVNASLQTLVNYYNPLVDEDDGRLRRADLGRVTVKDMEFECQNADEVRVKGKGKITVIGVFEKEAEIDQVFAL
jgi:hypothetical protein